MTGQYQAVLLRKVNYGENALILQTFTKEEGSLSFYTNRPKGKNKTILAPLSFLEITAKKGKGDLLRSREIRPLTLNDQLLSDVRKSCIVLFLNEVLSKSLREYHKDEALFDFLSDAFQELNHETEEYFNFHLSFMMELSRFLGFYPEKSSDEKAHFFDLHEGQFTHEQPIHSTFIPSEDVASFASLLNNRHLNDQQLKISNDERRRLLGYLCDYYRVHIEHFNELKSKEVLEQIFA